MFDGAIIVDVHPSMLALLVNGMSGLGEARVGEIAHGDGDEVRGRCHLPVHCRAARGTEVECNRAAAVAHACEGC